MEHGGLTPKPKPASFIAGRTIDLYRLVEGRGHVMCGDCVVTSLMVKHYTDQKHKTSNNPDSKG